jgi:hypothetical protein
MTPNKKEERQTTVQDFLSDFTVTEPRSNRGVWTPERNELHSATLTGTAEVSNDYGTSVMSTVLVGDDEEEMVWFCKGFENSDMRTFLEKTSSLPAQIKFVRTQTQSTKNPDRMVNRLFIKTV